jgi:hypothetical protein
MLRIRELESKLADSVTVAVYNRLLDRISELEERNQWQADMLLRRAGTFPLSAQKAITSESQPVPQRVAVDLDQVNAIRAEGRRLNLNDQEIQEGIYKTTGWSEADIAAAIKEQAE